MARMPTKDAASNGDTMVAERPVEAPQAEPSVFERKRMDELLLALRKTITVTRENIPIELSRAPTASLVNAIARGFGAISSDSAAKTSEKFGKGDASKTPAAIAFRDDIRAQAIADIYSGNWGSEPSEGDRLAQLIELWFKNDCRALATSKFTRKMSEAVTDASGKVVKAARPIDEWVDKEGKVKTLKDLIDGGVYRKTAKRVADAEASAKADYEAEQAAKRAKAASAASAVPMPQEEIGENEL